mgnify:CR=1 FL=1
MNDQQIMASFEYSFTVLLVLMLVVWYHLSGRIATLEKKHEINTNVLEGMYGGSYSNHGIKMKGMGYMQSDMGPPGSIGFKPSTQMNTDGFFGSSESPVFYDIGDVRSARTTRGWSTGYATDAAGNPVYDASGNPVMASKASDYNSVGARSAMYRGSSTDTYDTNDARLRSMGYVQSTDPLTGKPVWKIPGREGYFSPVSQEAMWSPSENFKTDEDLMYNM